MLARKVGSERQVTAKQFIPAQYKSALWHRARQPATMRLLAMPMNRGQTNHFYAFGPFRLDSEKHVLVRDSAPVSLSPKL
jgi:hypothetical protein